MNRLFKTMLLAGTVGMGLLAVGAGGARADIIPTLISVTPEGADFRWTYDASLHEDQEVVKGNFFTIYDFSGFVPGSNMQPGNWSFSSANIGLTPSRIIAPDDPSVPNLTWTYMGTDPTTAPDLGDFSALSLYSAEKVTAFASEGTLKADGTLVDNVGWATTPLVPEPCTMALLGLGAAPLLGGLRRRGRKA